MNIQELLYIIAKIAKQNNISKPFIVGGLPRDKALGMASEIKDIDLTTGDDGINALAILTSRYLIKQYPNLSLKVFPDGHSQMSVDGIKIDFSSNYHSPQAIPLLNKAGVKPTNMDVELISRDFTCNTLLLSLDFKTIKDPLGTGFSDIKKKLLRTPLPPKYTLSNDSKRIIRAIYLAAKLGFDVELPIIDFIKNNLNLLNNVKNNYITNKINESLTYDVDKTLYLLNVMNLWGVIPISEQLSQYASGRI